MGRKDKGEGKDEIVLIGNGGDDESILVSPPSNNYFRKNVFIALNVVGLLTLAYVVFIEVIHTWHEKFQPNLSTNLCSISLVLTSKTVIIASLLLLCNFALFCPETDSVEHLALGLMTVAPLLSICSILAWKNEPGTSTSLESKKGDLISEVLEFTGMVLLDVSQIPDSRVSCLLTEVVGYAILLASAMLCFDNVHFSTKDFWGITLKIIDRMLIADVFGLFSLVGFSVFLFHEKGVAERLKNRNFFQVIRDFIFDVPPSYYQGNNVIDYIFQT